MKNRYRRLKAMLLAGTLSLTSAGLTGCSDSVTNEECIVVLERESTHFDIGEHIVSVPIPESEDIRTRNYQYEAHPGYEVAGISITAHGKFDNVFGGGAILYANREEVDCSTNLKDENGNYVYLYFGTPTYNIVEEDTSNPQVKEFDVGEHIISIPMNEDNRNSVLQYEGHEGYEVVGIATSAHGKFDNVFGGGVLLYKNVVPVRCTLGEFGYTTFGVPQEVEKTRTIK